MYKHLTRNQKEKIETEIKLMLFSSRDCLFNRKELDKYSDQFKIDDGYYGEAFGILRTLKCLGYGYFGAINDYNEYNLKHWFESLQKEVIDEEKKYGLKDRYKYYCTKVIKLEEEH